MKLAIEKTVEMEKSSKNAKLLMGLFVILFGVLILFKQMGMEFPRYLISWEIILIMIGLVMLVKHNFKKTSAYVLIIIGSVFLINDFFPFTIQTKFIWPALIIFFGASILIKAMRGQKKNPYAKTVSQEQKSSSENGENYVSATAFFGGVTKNVVSKDFKGANITTIFGGTEINLSHADIQSRAVIDVSAIFGGITLIIPSNWKVQSEMTSVFGGIEDKRPAYNLQEDESKLLILKGNCVFGGVEIASYV
jgi:predicted membrane protein